MKKPYNWWTDPKNAEEVKRISWWDFPENQTTFPLPFSISFEDGWWVACTNDRTKEILGEHLHGTAQGKTREETVADMFSCIRFAHRYERDCRLRYQRWVPFRRGRWKGMATHWFVIFGIHVYFRYGKKMKGGWYIPFTKLNISVHSEWTEYRRWKQDQLNKNK